MEVQQVNDLMLIILQGLGAVALLFIIRILYNFGTVLSLNEALRRIYGLAVDVERAVDDKTDAIPVVAAALLSRFGVSVDAQKVSDFLERGLDTSILVLERLAKQMGEELNDKTESE